MSISDRLDEIEARANAATDGPWWGSMLGTHVEVFAGEGSGSDPMLASELRPGDAEFIVAARADVPAMLAALRAVIDLCDLIEKAHAANPKRTYEQGMEVAAHKVRTVIAAALGEGT